MFHSGDFGYDTVTLCLIGISNGLTCILNSAGFNNIYYMKQAFV